MVTGPGFEPWLCFGDKLPTLSEWISSCVRCHSGVEREALEREGQSPRKKLGLKPVALPVGRVRAQQLPLAGETTRGPLNGPLEQDSSEGEDLGALYFLRPPLSRSPCLFI